ncbi:MAG: HdeD family acid-resistance protein [Gemmatales bacterium]
MSSYLSMPDEKACLRRVSGQLFLLGLISIIAGFVAISYSVMATLASVTFFGILLMVAGGSEIIHAFLVRNLKGFALHLLAAALYLVVGLFMLEDPLQAALVLTKILAAYFIVGGVLRIIFSLAMQFHGWGWVALNGLVDLFLGLFIWNNWPDSSLWVIGLFIGIDLLFHGWSSVITAISVRANSGSSTK